MKAFVKIAVIIALVSGVAQAQSGTARSNYISVMSKAGTPTPRPSVPVRHVGLPAGAGAGYDYYYGYYRAGYGGGGSASPSYANSPAPSTTSTLPGYDSEPRRKRGPKTDGFGYSSVRGR